MRDASRESRAHACRFDDRFSLRSLFAIADEEKVTAHVWRHNASCLCQHGRPVPGAKRSNEPDDGLVFYAEPAPNLATAAVGPKLICVSAVRVHYYFLRGNIRIDQIAALD